ncbi:MAG: EAL domain-containing protein [Cyanobacteriota bacterium]|nr:EAL domain-containing protein [Cyanobacteriota bacterium]
MSLWCENRERLLDELGELQQANRAGALLSCCFRHYARVEALHGQRHAERLISAGQQRLQQLCPAGTVVLRLQADELALVIPDGLSLTALEALAHRCSSHCSVEQQSGEPPLLLHVAIGAALAGSAAAADSEAVLATARLARHQAEQRPGSQVALATPMLQHQAAQNYDCACSLASAIEQHQLIAHLQPIVSLADGEAIGFECLARWPQTDGTLIHPQDFLIQAHNAGLTASIDLQTLAFCLKAAPQLAEAAGPARRLMLSANISAALLESPRQIEALLDLISSHPLPANMQLQLELLEESLNNTACELDTLLEWLSEQHVLIAIDDFGTGYSSLSRLHDLAVNTIKVDRSFVTRINAPSKPSNHLLSSLVAISHDLQMTLTAEGIETESQRQWLREQGVEHGQGFLFSEPLSLAAALDYLKGLNDSQKGAITS